jgi:D-inositol-3-phosphate glycosyltransferase
MQQSLSSPSRAACGACDPDVTATNNADSTSVVRPGQPVNIAVALLTGGIDRSYVFGLSMALISKGICVDVIGSDSVDSSEMHTTSGLTFLNLQSTPLPSASFVRRAWAVLAFYVRFVRYTSISKPKIFHILWNNKLQFLDRTLLMLYFKLLGKKIAVTAHNVNARVRDGNDSVINRLTLRFQYQLADHIFVHTKRMKSELVETFNVSEGAVSVIPFGVNNAVPDTYLTAAEAKERLGIGCGEKTILFFGAIWPYKGLEYLVAAFCRLANQDADYRLIIAGAGKKGSEEYVAEIRKALSQVKPGRVIERIQYIPDADTELYFKAADLSVLPYTMIFQSGVLVLSYSFGLPVVATNVGSFAEDIIPGKTGLMCRPRDGGDLARAIEEYFDGELYRNLERRRQGIRDYAMARYSWDVVGDMTRKVYSELMAAHN